MNSDPARAYAPLTWLLLFGFWLIFAPSARAESAGEMASYCEPYRTAVIVGNEQIRIEHPGQNSNICWGAFAAVQDFATMGFPGHNEGILRLCLPPESDRLELVKVFVRYMDENPNKGHWRFGTVLLLSLSEAFPCQPPLRH
jgi:hypothetical protein